MLDSESNRENDISEEEELLMMVKGTGIHDHHHDHQHLSSDGFFCDGLSK